MNLYSISGYDWKGIWHFFYHEAKTKKEVEEWVKLIGYNYRDLRIEFICKGGFDALDKMKGK